MEVQGISKYFKRKSRSSSSETDNTPKKNRAESPTVFENSPSAITEQAADIDNSIEDSRVVDEALEMIEGVGAKLDQVLLKLDNLEDRVNVIHKDLTVIKEKLNELDSRVSVTEKKTKDLEEAVEFVCEDTKELKVKAEKSYADAKEEVKKLKLHILNMEVYQRRENLRFYGIEEKESSEAGNTETILKDFMQDELDIHDAWGIKLQRVHRVGKKIQGKPRPIIARFLNYPDRERIFSARKTLERSSGFSIGPDFPKEVVNMRKILIPKLVKARKEGKRAYFSKPEPYKLFIDGQEVN